MYSLKNYFTQIARSFWVYGAVLSLFETPPGLWPACRRRAYLPAVAGKLLRVLPSPAPTGDEPEAIPFLKRFTVFNAGQCEDLPVNIAPPQPVAENLILPQAEALICATGADIRIGGNRAFYVPSADYIQVSPPAAFFEPINFHRTVCHELGHWSGAPHRLNRDLSGGFGSASYAREELVAEITGAFVCAALSIEPTVRHADYLGSWLDVLREDNRAIIRAASAASKAADYLLAFRDAAIIPDTEDDRTVPPAPQAIPRGAAMTAASSIRRCVRGTNLSYASLAEWLALVYCIGGRTQCSRRHYAAAAGSTAALASATSAQAAIFPPSKPANGFSIAPAAPATFPAATGCNAN
jgi:Zincin-like metallopeptidase